MVCRSVKRRPIDMGECIRVRPMMKQRLIARPIVRKRCNAEQSRRPLRPRRYRRLPSYAERSLHRHFGFQFLRYALSIPIGHDQKPEDDKSEVRPVFFWPCLCTLQGLEYGGRMKQCRVLSQLRPGYLVDFESGVSVQSSQEKRLGVKEVVLLNHTKHLLQRTLSIRHLFWRTVPRSCPTLRGLRNASVSL